MTGRGVPIRCQTRACGKWLATIEPQTAITAGGIVLICPRCKCETIIGARVGHPPAWAIRRAA